jgi:GNAT superfamily N-acetyltransferase
MLAPDTLDAVDGYWAGFLGVARSRLRPPRPLAVPHAGLGDYRGMYAQAFGGAPLVSLPLAMLERFGRDAAEAAGGGFADEGRWRAVFGERADVVVGPALIAYADAGTLRRPTADAGVRPLEEGDRPALDALRAALTPVEWEHGGSELDAGPVFGAFVDGALAAVSGWEVWGRRIAHLSIATHPAHRGRGLGTAAVAHAAGAALQGGLIPQYRALVANAQSLRVAARLGFTGYAQSLAVRFRPDASTK